LTHFESEHLARGGSKELSGGSEGPQENEDFPESKRKKKVKIDEQRRISGQRLGHAGGEGIEVESPNHAKNRLLVDDLKGIPALNTQEESEDEEKRKGEAPEQFT
jgi:hypothetical protein